MPYGRIDTETDAEFTEKSVQLLALHLRVFLAEHDRCVIGLSGGSTPMKIYEELGKDDTLDWSRVFLFLVDDRYVPPTHADSNQKLLRETLLAEAGVLHKHIVFPNTLLPLEKCVEDYDRRLGFLLGKGTPDIVTLGLGDDGHTASLFPPLTDAAFAEDRLAVATTVPDGADGRPRFAVRNRISVTLPLLASAKIPIFFLKGEVKKKIWDEMITAGEADPKRWPAQAILGTGRATVVINS